MEPFAHELQTVFHNKLESDHVIDKEQVLIGIVEKGVDGKLFNFSYVNRENSDMFLDLGKSILAVTSYIPDGMLVFFPSYYLMEN